MSDLYLISLWRVIAPRKAWSHLIYILHSLRSCWRLDTVLYAVRARLLVSYLAWELLRQHSRGAGIVTCSGTYQFRCMVLRHNWGRVCLLIRTWVPIIYCYVKRVIDDVDRRWVGRLVVGPGDFIPLLFALNLRRLVPIIAVAAASRIGRLTNTILSVTDIYIC